MFEKSVLNVRNQRNQRLVRILFLLMTVLLILPVLAILGVLVAKGGPILSWEFLFEEPTQGMTAGGIFPALIGTVWLVAVALLASGRIVSRHYKSLLPSYDVFDEGRYFEPAREVQAEDI